MIPDVLIPELPSSQAVTGPLTSAELRATANPMQGVLECILVELRVISFLLNEGMNTQENLDHLRKDMEE